MHLVGRQGRIHSIPNTTTQRLCAVQFNDTRTIHHVPMSSLTLCTGNTQPSSPEMQALLQKQFQEVKQLQTQYNDARRLNPVMLPRIQLALATLRNKHLAQIQVLKNSLANKN